MKSLTYLFLAVVLLSGCCKMLNPTRKVKHTDDQQDRYENLDPWADITKTPDVLGVYINGQKTLSQICRYNPIVMQKAVWLDIIRSESKAIIRTQIYESAYWRGDMEIQFSLDDLALKKSSPAMVIRDNGTIRDTMSIASIDFDTTIDDSSVLIGSFEFDGVVDGKEVSGRRGIFNLKI